MKSFTRFFSKNRGNGRGMSPGVRIESGHPKKRLPAIRRGRHFPQAGNRAFSQVVRLFSIAVYRPLSRKAGTSGLRSKTWVQQHPKNAQKTPGASDAPGFLLLYFFIRPPPRSAPASFRPAARYAPGFLRRLPRRTGRIRCRAAGSYKTGRGSSAAGRPG